jgi:hypothetical protein
MLEVVASAKSRFGVDKDEIVAYVRVGALARLEERGAGNRMVTQAQEQQMEPNKAKRTLNKAEYRLGYPQKLPVRNISKRQQPWGSQSVHISRQFSCREAFRLK